MTSISQRAMDFNNWTNSSENYEKTFQKGQEVEEFQMFEFNASTYSSDLKDFAQEYIDSFDKDGDGSWNKDEFISMALNREDISDVKDTAEFMDSLLDIYEEAIASKDADKDGSWSKDEFLQYFDIDSSTLTADEKREWDEAFESYNSLNLDFDPKHISSAELAVISNLKTMPKLPELYSNYEMYENVSKTFDDLNIDGDNTSLSAEEYASELYLSDLDLETYGQTGSIADSLDGKLNYATFQTTPVLQGDSKEFMDNEKKDFFDAFYAE